MSDCSDVHVWLASARQTDAVLSPTVKIAEHVATCSICQSMLLLLLTDLLPHPLHSLSISHDDCLEDLPAAIDHELSDGSIASVREFPKVWWHLWNCPNCAETYEITRLLAAAEQTGLLPPLPSILEIPPRPPLLTPLLQLSRDFLSMVLPLASAATPTRGHQNDETVILSEPLGQSYVTISLVEVESGRWRMTVAVIPPPSGQLVVSMGDAFWRAPFDANGTAQITPIDGALLQATSGDAMQLGIEQG